VSTTPEPPLQSEDGRSGPKIGADEWVARSGERIMGGGALRQAFDRLPKPVVFGGGFGLVALVPALTALSSNDSYFLRVGTVTLVFALLALGLNVAVGFAGLLDLGYIAYYGVGAYGYAMLSSSKFGFHLQAWESIPIVIAVAAMLGFFLSLPSRRLIGDYLAIVTLFFGQIFFVLVSQGYQVSLLGLNNDLGLRSNWDLTGGPNGIANVDRVNAFGAEVTSERGYYYVALVAVVIVFATLSLASRSRTGRAWRALNDDSLAAQAMSIPINWLKLLAIGVGASAAGLAGAINAALLQGAFPDDYNTQVLIIIYAMVVLGGVGSLTGAVFGAFIVNVVLLEALRPQTPISDWTSNGRWLLYTAVVFALLAKLRPWRRLALVLSGLAAFGLIVHGVVALSTAHGVDGRLNTGPAEFGSGGSLGWLIRHWLALPAGTYETGAQTLFNVALIGLIACVLVLTLLHGWQRDLLLIPTVWLGAFVWETRLVEEGSGPTRLLLLGVMLILVVTIRPQGLLGKPRVEIV
jgi:ABC-type branched-subunit amino acid transport system permease subunit